MTPGKVGPLKDPIPQEQLEKVASVAPKMEIQEVRLVGIDCNLRRPLDADERTLSGDYDVSYRVVEETYLGVTIRFVAFASAKADGEEQEHPLVLGATYFLLYESEGMGEMDEEALSGFVGINALYNAWPYWRELVQNMIGRMGLPSLTLPLLKLREVNEDAEDDKPKELAGKI